MSAKYVIAIVAGATIAIMSVSSSFALSSKALGDIAAGAQRHHQQEGIKKAVGNMGQMRDGIGRAAAGAAGGAAAVPKLKFGCYNPFGC